MAEVREAVIVEAVRTPIGKRNGSLKDFHPVDLLADVLKEVVNRAGVDPGQIEDNITGCVSQVGEQSLNVGRNGWLAAGFPETIPATTVDRQCGSSQQSIHFAAQGVMAGAYDLVMASGIEHMTLVPQGISAELIATRWKLSRDDMDDFAYRSHVRAARATREGYLRREIVPIKVEGNGTDLLEHDEGIRFDPDRAKMGTLQPSFQ